jgi:hypothetical protein
MVVGAILVLAVLRTRDMKAIEPEAQPMMAGA